MVKDQFLCDPAAEKNRDIIKQIILGICMPFIYRKLLCDAKRTPSRYNRYLVDGVRPGIILATRACPAS